MKKQNRRQHSNFRNGSKLDYLRKGELNKDFSSPEKILSSYHLLWKCTQPLTPWVF